MFEYRPVDEENCGGAAVDYVLTAGDIIQGVGRCCENCTLINGWLGIGQYGEDQIGGFTRAELRPLTAAAREMLALVPR